MNTEPSSKWDASWVKAGSWVAVAIVLTLGLAACGGGVAAVATTNQIPQEDPVTLGAFRDALEAGEECSVLFEMRDQLPNATQKDHADGDLERISCSDTDSVRVDPPMSEPERGRRNFEHHIKNAFAGAGYEVPDDAQVAALLRAAFGTCSAIEDGLSFDVVIRVAEFEYGDSDIANSIVYGALTYICPDR